MCLFSSRWKAQTVRLQQGDPAALRPLLAPPGRTASSRVIHALMRSSISRRNSRSVSPLMADGASAPSRRLHAYFHARLIDHFAAAVPGGDPGIQTRSPIRLRGLRLDEDYGILIGQSALEQRIEGVCLNVVEDGGLEIGRRRLAIRPSCSRIAAAEGGQAKEGEGQGGTISASALASWWLPPSAGRTMAARAWLPRRSLWNEWRGYAKKSSLCPEQFVATKKQGACADSGRVGRGTRPTTQHGGPRSSAHPTKSGNSQNLFASNNIGPARPQG